MTALDPNVTKLADALNAALPADDEDLVGDFMAATEDRVLRIVRRLCHEYEAPDLWRRIACLVLDLDHLSAKDDSTYLPTRAA